MLDRLFDVSSDHYQGSGHLDTGAGTAADYPVLLSWSGGIHVCGDVIGPDAEEGTVLRGIRTVERCWICGAAL